MLLNPEINSFCKERELEFTMISEERKEKLLLLRDYIQSCNEENRTPKLIVICTHNSRRSHLGQIWLSVGADYFGLPTVHTFSGGTEATAFNIRAVRAMKKIGFVISADDNNKENPVYQISWKKGMVPYQAFSKKYDHPTNPRENFAAIMVCSEADVGCPVILGSEFRLSLPYDDPKAFDETELEEAKYEERAKDIGREMLFLYSQLI